MFNKRGFGSAWSCSEFNISGVDLAPLFDRVVSVIAGIVSLLPEDEGKGDNDGPIGNEILRRSKVTIDYSR
jgi:hypothetical protein